MPTVIKTLASATCLAALAAAATVHLKVNGDTEGQGWLFFDTDSRCKVITPTHVVEIGGSRIASNVRVIDGHGRELPVGPPQILSESRNLDVALLIVSGPGDPATCGDARLSGIGVARRLGGTADL